MRINYKLQDRFDFAIFLPVLFLMIAGLLAIYSSTVNHPTAHGNFQRQVYWAGFSLLVFFFIYSLPQQTFKMFALAAYSVSIIFLIAVLVVGKTVYGSKSWFGIGSFGFQPSEFAKLGTILLLSYWLTYKNRDFNNLFDIGIALVIGLIPVLGRNQFVRAIRGSIARDNDSCFHVRNLRFFSRADFCDCGIILF